MKSRKKFNLIIGAFIVLVSFFAIILSDSSSKFAIPFTSPDEPEESEEILIDEDVMGTSEYSAPDFQPKNEENQNTQDPVGEEIYQEPKETGFKVVKVVDGDTIDVLIDDKTQRLRLIGIDTPETVDPRKKVQCFGREASNKAKELLNGQFVSLENDESQGERDKYKRLLRYVFLQDGTNFNLYMIAEGYAHEYTYDQPYKYQYDFKEAERSALENNKGLWSPDTCSGNK